MGKFYWSVAAFLLLSGCSFQATLDQMVSPVRQGELIAVGKRFCTDPASLSKWLHPQIATSVSEVAAQLPQECVRADARWQLASYQSRINITDGRKERQEDVVVVGSGTAKWTSVSMRFYADNDAPMTIVQWNVAGSAAKPPALVFIDQYEQGAKALRVAVPLLLVAIGALIVWLVRRRRAKRAA